MSGIVLPAASSSTHCGGWSTADTTPPGVAVLDGTGGLAVRRRRGTLANLEARSTRPTRACSTGSTGHGAHPLGHPRRPDRPQRPPAPRRQRQGRRHPQRDHRELRRRCGPSWRPTGIEFASDTDTEVAAHLLGAVPQRPHRGRPAGVSVLAVLPAPGGRLHPGRRATPTSPGMLVAARRNSPLVVGVGDGEMFLASDVAAFIEHTRDAVELGQDQLVVITPDGYRDHLTSTGPTYRDGSRLSHRLGPVRRREGRLRLLHAQGDRRAARGGRRHAARALRRRPDRPRRAAPLRPGPARRRQGLRGRLRHRVPLRPARQVRDRALDPAARRGRAGQRVPLPRPGSRPEHAGRRHLASPARPPTRWRPSGTPRSRRPGCSRSATPTAAQIPRESDAVLYTHAGPEIGVASTKTFLAQVAANYLVGLALAQARGTKYPDEVEREYRRARVDARSRQPGADAAWSPVARAGPASSRRRRRCCSSAATSATRSRWRARSSSRNWPTCTPRASPPASSSTGPIALIEDGLPVVVVMPSPKNAAMLHSKLLSNIREIQARGARTIVIAEEGDDTVRAVRRPPDRNPGRAQRCSSRC